MRQERVLGCQLKSVRFHLLQQVIPANPHLHRRADRSLGLLELVCAAGLVLPSAFRWHPALTVAAATILAFESLVFIWVHIKYRETGSIIMSGVLGALMAFVAYGRHALAPIL